MDECLHQEAVKWNPYNKVVQCHKCGQVFMPKKDEKEIEEIIGQAIGEGSLCWDEPSVGIFDSAKASKIVKETTQKIIKLNNN